MTVILVCFRFAVNPLLSQFLAILQSVSLQPSQIDYVLHGLKVTVNPCLLQKECHSLTISDSISVLIYLKVTLSLTI